MTIGARQLDEAGPDMDGVASAVVPSGQYLDGMGIHSGKGAAGHPW